MATPVPTVEIAFGSRWDEVNPTWTDVSTYLTGVAFDRMFSWETGLYQGGRLTCTLDDPDRALDPWNVNGTYYGQMTPMTQIRVTEAHDGTTHTLWRGFVEAFDRHYTGFGTGTTAVSAVDAWSVLTAAATSRAVGGALVGSAIVDTSTVGGTASVSGEQQLTSARVTEALYASGWPTGRQTVQAGMIEMPAETSDADSIITVIGQAVAAESGAAWVDREGNFRFDARTAITAARIATTDQTTFSNLAADSSVDRYYAPSLSVDYGDLVNDITVTRIDGDTAVNVQDATSVAAYGRRGPSPITDLRVLDDVQAAVSASLIIDQRSDTTTRVPPVVVDVINDTGQEHLDACTRELRDRVRWKFEPPTGDTIDLDFHIIGIAQSWTSTPGGGAWWTVTYDLADAALVDRLAPTEWAVVGTAVVDTSKAYY